MPPIRRITPGASRVLAPGEAATPENIAPAALLSNQVAPAPFNDRFVRTLGSDLTPQQVTLVLNNADSGYLWQLADLCDEIRERDGHLHSELQKRELRVAGADWELVPPEGSGERGETIAKWCTARINEIEGNGDLSRGFSAAVADLQGAVFQGRVGLEAVWRDDGGWYVPRELLFLHARRFAYGTDWRAHIWDASGTSPTAWQPMNTDSPFGVFPGLPIDRFPAGKFIVHRPRVRGVYPVKEGLGRLLVWWATFKRFAVRDFAAFAEWAGRGLRIGYYATGRGPMGEFPASPEDQQVIQQVLDAMSSSNSGVFADTTKPEIINSPSNNDVHRNLVALCNAEVSKAVLGGTLGSEGSAGGNRALGEVHERGELMIARGDAAQISGTLVRDLIRPMVHMNFGPGAPVPRFRFAVDPAQDLDAVAKRLFGFVDHGGELAQTDARNLLNLPDPSPGATLLQPEKVAASSAPVAATPKNTSQ